ncbi:ribosome biogenesis GTPase YlqF [uncultured Peptoniphilus sp.]|uniref:ribosome biogenesis GTPase YlqF n=1 Tax=uncultured Peptoniphilus sp. TaxID=254354 RepID=UPI002805DA7A|nr:ribosome biogenesis GTPase YlqF [uncultured Peptoniphilus sp.]
MNINWYPGHMKKTIEDLEKKKGLVDFVIEIIDGRIPLSSRNPLLEKVLEGKKKLIIFNKSDLADEKENDKWINFLTKDEVSVLKYNSQRPNPVSVTSYAEKLMADEIKKYESRGVNHGPLRAMVVGIPNVGKSTFINGIIGKKSAKTGNRPGITKTNQWIRLNEGLHLLDTPGVLWQKFPEDIGLNLALTGSIKDEIMDRESLSLKLIEKLNAIDKNILINRYKIENNGKPLEVLDEIGRKRGALLRGGLIDYEKTSGILLDEFRKGLLGRISLETV